MGGAASGKYEVKSCGKAHAWCTECMPEMADKLRKPKPPPKAGMPPCLKCGRCDYCLGLVAPEGMKICRKCGETKPLKAFSRRNDTGGYRNICMACGNKGQQTGFCEGCGNRFVLSAPGRTLCPACRPKLTKPCATCGKQFVGTTELRLYCSDECRDVAFKGKRDAKRKEQRMEMLLAYSNDGKPACVCCGELILLFLALDHINGGGHKQMRELGGGGYSNWLRKNNYPAGFRILCHNCNYGCHLNGGICPHEQGELDGVPAEGGALRA